MTGTRTGPELDLVAEMGSRPLVLTQHGECRMACRRIDQSEVKASLQSGQHMPDRTRTDGECPSHAFEHYTLDGQHIRVVLAHCPAETRSVTAIDLGQD